MDDRQAQIAVSSLNFNSDKVKMGQSQDSQLYIFENNFHKLHSYKYLQKPSTN
jgi:hypothetical protein